MTDAPVSPAGWHPDPSDPAFLRWWDGATWTDERQPRPPELATIGGESEGGGLAAVGFVLAVIVPAIGLLVGLAMVAGRRRNGGWVMITAVVAFVVWVAIIYAASS